MDDSEDPQSGAMRRAELEIGTAAVTVFVTGRALAVPAADLPDTDPSTSLVTVDFPVDDRRHSLSLDPRTTLLDVLQEHLALTGSKKGCNRGQALPAA
jgi:xanthine dehydrogenase YagT iron-sulfur-binding subunit